MTHSNPDEIGQINAKNLVIPANLTTRKVYIVTVAGDKKTVFFATTLTEKTTTIEIQGFEISKIKLDKITATDYNQYIATVKEQAGDVKVKSLMVPWHKVDRIEVIVMQVKKTENR